MPPIHSGYVTMNMLQIQFAPLDISLNHSFHPELPTIKS